MGKVSLLGDVYWKEIIKHVFILAEESGRYVNSALIFWVEIVSIVPTPCC